MIPIALDPRRTRLGLVGRGELAVRRLRGLRAGGAAPDVFSDAPAADLASEAGAGLRARLPDATDLAALDLLWIADLPAELAQPLVAAAKRAKVLVNLEDVIAACDFHNSSVVRRGDLTVAISTAGKSPALAVRLRRWLEARLDEGWAERLDDLAVRRAAWRRRSRSIEELSRLAEARMDAKGWLAGGREVA